MILLLTAVATLLRKRSVAVPAYFKNVKHESDKPGDHSIFFFGAKDVRLMCILKTINDNRCTLVIRDWNSEFNDQNTIYNLLKLVIKDAGKRHIRLMFEKHRISESFLYVLFRLNLIIQVEKMRKYKVESGEDVIYTFATGHHKIKIPKSIIKKRTFYAKQIILKCNGGD